MIEISKKSECCGCYGCINVCPKQCIDMNIDEEGFWYPRVNKDKCINCNLCEKVCPFINESQQEKFDTIAYACKNKNNDIRLESSSGGVFTCLCDYVINNNGVVFGAAFNYKFEVEHVEAKTMEECRQFRGAKYVQSKIGRSYITAKEYLDMGRLVLFSGTPCQIKGLNLYLRKKYDNLICIDIACHGVPSPLVFEKYKSKLKNEYNSNIKSITFRDKTYSWKNYNYKIDFKNGKSDSKHFRKNIYSKGFLKDLYLRPSCYECKAKIDQKSSDLQLGDYWGIENKHPEFNDDKGVSLVLVNSQKGMDILDNISKYIDTINTELNYAIDRNPCIKKSVKYNKKREKFFEKLDREDLYTLIEKNTKDPFYKKIKIICRYLKNIYRIGK